MQELLYNKTTLTFAAEINTPRNWKTYNSNSKASEVLAKLPGLSLLIFLKFFQILFLKIWK
jgi:hypothetical protein